MRVALTFGFFGMLRQSNLAPPTAVLFDRSRHTCRVDIIQAPPGLLIVIRWSKSHQTVASSPVLPFPAVLGHPSGGAMAAHMRGLHQEMIKRHGMWSSDSFWTYITSLGVASSLLGRHGQRGLSFP